MAANAMRLVTRRNAAAMLYAARIEVAPPNELDAITVAQDMRAADRAEVAAMQACGPGVAIARSLGVSIEAYAGRVDGVAVCLFGVGAGSLVSGVGRPWLLATDAIEQHRVAFLRRNRAMVQSWQRRFPVLENWCAAEHVRNHEWLRWLGFTLHPAEPFGPFGKSFHRFDMRR